MPRSTPDDPTGLLLQPSAICLDAVADDAEDAIRQVGRLLVDVGAVEPSYVDAMLEREHSVSTVVAEGVAIPHGTLQSKEAVRRDALSVVRFPAGVDWNGVPVTIAIGIAATGDGHGGVLARLASVLADSASARALRACDDPQQVIDLLEPSAGDPQA